MTRVLDQNAPPITTHLRPLWLCYLCTFGWASLCAFLFGLASTACEDVWPSTPLADALERAAASAPLAVVALTAWRSCRPRVGTRWMVAAILAAAGVHYALWFADSESMAMLITLAVHPAAFLLSWASIGLLVGLAVPRRGRKATRAPLWGAAIAAAFSILWLAAGAPGEAWLNPGLSSLVAVDVGACYALIWLASLPPAPGPLATARVSARDESSPPRI